MSRVAIITVAGVSSRFNKGVPENNKVLKCLYTESDNKDTLLYRMLEKLSYADHIIVVGGYKFNDLQLYVDECVPVERREKITLVYNNHFEDLSSGYSLYVGLKNAFDNCDNISNILFAEGDLDVDKESLNAVIKASSTVLTYNYEIIKADKAVVLYVDEECHYKYAFNSSHGLLNISDSFSAIYNSGQIWKFSNINALKIANEVFEAKHIGDTNLAIIQEYLNQISADQVVVLPLKRWTNCNTRDDYRHIKENWQYENS